MSVYELYQDFEVSEDVEFEEYLPEDPEVIYETTKHQNTTEEESDVVEMPTTTTRDVKVVLVMPDEKQHLITLETNKNNDLQDVINEVHSFISKKTSLKEYDLNIHEVIDPNFDYIFDIKQEISICNESIRDMDDILNDSNFSTKLNLFELSDKENEDDEIQKHEVTKCIESPNAESCGARLSVVDDSSDDDTILLESSTENDSIKKSKRKAALSKSESPKAKMLFIYPPPPEKGGMPIYRHDYECLAENEFLNDVIIDFYLKYLMCEVLSEKDRARTHIFSSHFYTRLDTDYTADDGIADAKKKHMGVERWTKNVNIFEKDFIIIPINEHSHWYLIIICFAHLIGKIGTGDTDCVNDGVELKKPCILVFDSLYSSRKLGVVSKLRDYLFYEYSAKMNDTCQFLNDDIPLVKPKIPKQSNSTDCGLFILQYVENFFKEPIRDFTLPLRNLKTWFNAEIIQNKREEIAKLITKLAIDFNQGKNVDLPKIKFPVKSRIDVSEKSYTNIKKRLSTVIDDDSIDETSESSERIENKQNTKKENKFFKSKTSSYFTPTKRKTLKCIEISPFKVEDSIQDTNNSSTSIYCTVNNDLSAQHLKINRSSKQDSTSSYSVNMNRYAPGIQISFDTVEKSQTNSKKQNIKSLFNQIDLPTFSLNRTKLVNSNSNNSSNSSSCMNRIQRASEHLSNRFSTEKFYKSKYIPTKDSKLVNTLPSIPKDMKIKKINRDLTDFI